MPLYVDQSVRAGPFRFDVLHGGAGLSSSSMLAKLGIEPRAHFIRARDGGVRYQRSVESDRPPEAKSIQTSSPESMFIGNVQMVEVESGDILEMRNEQFGAILDEINAHEQAIRLAVVLPTVVVLTSLAACYLLQFECILLAFSASLFWLLGRWLDEYRRVTVLVYDLGEGIEGAFRRLTEAFDQMMGCAGKWHIEAGGAVTDLATWKQNAGASHLVQRNVTVLAYNLPDRFKSNVTPPALRVGRQIIYFLPDVALVQDGGTFGAVSYADLLIRWQASDSTEVGEVPSDTYVVGYTWEHPNISGGPDRRFKNNRQLPVCRYEAVHISSPNGVNELVEFSRQGVGQSLAAAVGNLSNPYFGAMSSIYFGRYDNAFTLPWRPTI